MLDAEEEEEEEEEMEEIPMLNRHVFGKKEMGGESRIESREEILEQRQAMLEEEIMKEDAMDDLEDANGGMSEEMDYGGAYVQ